MKKNNIIACIIAVLLVILCFVPAFYLKSRSTDEYEIWFLGDSIIAGDAMGNSIPAYVSAATGRSTLNGAFGGMGMSKPEKADITAVTYSYNMVDISEGIKYKDLTYVALNTMEGNPYNLPYWEKHAKDLSKADFDKCKFIFVEYGTNDCFNGAPVDSLNNPYDTKTFGGALRTVIENIQTGMPNAKIILITSPYNNVATDGSLSLEDYVNREIEIAGEYGIEVIDNYVLSGINETNYTEYLSDGIHPNQDGIALLSKPIIDMLNQ